MQEIWTFWTPAESSLWSTSYPAICVPPGKSLYWLIDTKSLKEEEWKIMKRDFPVGPVAKTSHSQCRETKFEPWFGN